MSSSLNPASAIEILSGTLMTKGTENIGNRKYQKMKLHCSPPCPHPVGSRAMMALTYLGVNPKEVEFKGTFEKMIDRRGNSKEATTHLGEGSSQESLGKDWMLHYTIT